AAFALELAVANVFDELLQPFVVETEAVDDALRRGKTEQARTRIARLWTGRYGADFKKAKTHRGQRINITAVLVQPCRQANPVLDRQSHQRGRRGGLRRFFQQAAAVSLLQAVQRQVVGFFRFQQEQKGT